jgi:hypothetical protein
VDRFVQRFGANSMIFAVQTFERMIQASVDSVVTRFDSWSVIDFHFNAPGQNSGVLLGSIMGVQKDQN